MTAYDFSTLRRFLLLGSLVLACRAKSRPAPDAATAPAVSAVAALPSAVRAGHHRVAVALRGGGTMSETAPYGLVDDKPRPVTIILHALCADEIWMCDWLQYGQLPSQWQLCPRGPVACGNGGAQWTPRGDVTLAMIEDAIATSRGRHGARVGNDVVLAGMSQGAYAIAHVIRELAKSPQPSLTIRGVVLHGARVEVSASDAKKLGLRVVLAAGDQDGAAPAMRALAASLKSRGVDARYASFGKVGHFLPVDTAATMVELIEWARAR